jgi:hypothetical protein
MAIAVHHAYDRIASVARQEPAPQRQVLVPGAKSHVFLGKAHEARIFGQRYPFYPGQGIAHTGRYPDEDDEHRQYDAQANNDPSSHALMVLIQNPAETGRFSAFYRRRDC